MAVICYNVLLLRQADLMYGFVLLCPFSVHIGCMAVSVYIASQCVCMASITTSNIMSFNRKLSAHVD